MLAFLPFAGPAVAAIACVRRMPNKKADDKSRGDLGVDVAYYMDQTSSLDNACGVVRLFTQGMRGTSGPPRLAIFTHFPMNSHAIS
jgi:hypothetical protein